MTSFIFIAVLITIVVVALLLRPLLKHRDSRSYERRAQNIHFAKQRLQELEQQLENTSISTEDYQALKREIESNLADDLDLNQQTQTQSQSAQETSNGILITILCSLIPFAGLVLYMVTGTPQALTPQAEPTPVTSSSDSRSNTRANTGGPSSQQDIDDMVRTLEERLKNQPDDTEGWAMMARTYLALGRYAESIEANKTLLKLAGDNPDVFASMADASALQAGGMLQGQPYRYVLQALALNPQHFQGLWLAGLNAAQQGDSTEASRYWNKLLPLLDDDPEQQQELQRIIAQTSEQQALPEITKPDPETAANSPNASSQAAGITVSVSLSESAIQLSKPDDVVFVFAKAKNGPPAPLAVKRLRVADLPIKIQLSDSDAMMPRFRLSLFEDVIISARIAKSGNPIAQAGDIQSAKITTKNNNDSTIELTISEPVL